jgi:serralysin
LLLAFVVGPAFGATQQRHGWVRTPPPTLVEVDPEAPTEISAIWETDGELFCDYTPGTTSAGSPNAFTFSDSNRWSATTTDGWGLERGEPTTLTWGFMRDGTSIHGYIGEPTAPSDLIAFLDSIRGQGPGGTDLTQRPWFDLFERVLEQWSEHTGVRYIYEPADDSAPLTATNVPGGEAGVRADVRIGGHYIDGQSGSNVLAYNFYPNAGDMVLDTSNSSFYASTTNDSRAMRNALAHEHGHGLGIAHVCPVNATKLMEPFVSTSYDGVREDDVLAGNRGYGDTLEPPAGNDTLGVATFLGDLGDSGGAAVQGVSVDGLSDVDVYAFSAAAGSLATVTLTPTGSTYLSGPQNANGSCSAGTDFDTRRQSDLTLELLAPTGSSLAYVDAGGLGDAEALTGVALPGGAGSYFVVVEGRHDKAQMYRVEITLEPSPVAVLSLLHVGSDDPALQGASLWYTVTLTNSGGSASQVVATTSLRTGAELLETVGCAEDPIGVPACSLGTIEAGASKSFTARVAVLAGAGQLEASVDVTWNGGGPIGHVEVTEVIAGTCAVADLILDHSDNGSATAFLSEGSIEARDGFMVAGGESTRLVAGDSIVFASGFSVGSGGSLRARTDSAVRCD